MFSIDSRSRTPIYEQLKQNIIANVASGALAADDQLPSVRVLARDLGVNPNTVQKAYQELEQAGFIYQAAGRGSFIAPNEALTQSLTTKYINQLRELISEAAKANVALEQVISLVKEIYRGDNK